jgi:hypothetical protein
VTTDATVEVVDHGGPHTIVRLKVSDVESDPIAPGWMGWQTAEGDQISFAVHRLLSRNGKRIILEALERSDLPLPAVGQQVSYTSMWSPDQLSLVTDVSRTWALVHIDRSSADKYLASPGTAERPQTDAGIAIDYSDFCGLCWERIASLDLAYSSTGEWICEPCFAKYLERDLLELRSPAP